MAIENRNLFRLTRFVIFKISGLFKFFAKFRSPKKRLLIIKTDAIGDYILFRNFLEIVKTSKKYSNYEIDVLGNALWKDAALQYDAPFVAEFIFTRHAGLYEAPLQTLKLGWKLFTRNYEVVLQPSSTRLLITDGLAALSAAKQIVGYVSDTEGIQEKYKRKTDNFYTRLLQLPGDVYFEFDRNRYFFEQVLEQKLTITGPYIPTPKIEKSGIIIFPGAGIVKRSWEKEKFLELIKLVASQYKGPILVPGGPGEATTAQYLADSMPAGTVTNLIGKTTIPQLIDLIGSAQLLISNETSVTHIAAATQTPSVCILGGGHFGRFAPYPDHMAHKPICVYDKMECFNCNWNCIYQTQPEAPQPCVSIVGVEQVWNIIESIVH